MTRFKSLAIVGVAAILSLGAATMVAAVQFPNGTVVTTVYPDGRIVR